MDTKFYRIEEVAALTGFTKRALRYYEDIELIRPSRTESSYRLYSEEDIESVFKIKELRDSLGFSLGEVKDILELEKDLKSILRGESPDSDLIEKSIDLLKNQIELIEEKERSLEKVKAKYEEGLQKLQAFSRR